MQHLFGKTKEEIQLICEELGCKRFVANQICDWIYKKNVATVMDMVNISKNIRENLSNLYDVCLTPYSKEVISKDGTRKYLFEYADNVLIEAVLIFDNLRTTLCISSQAGCKMNCAFCATGHMGFVRDLTSYEILNIYQTLNNRLAQIHLPKQPSDTTLSINNIVFMGMGEPLDNFEEVDKVLQILTNEWGYALSPRRITISTCGYMPKMKELLEKTNVDVAISLHNAISKERKELMPIEKTYPIEEVINLLKQYDWTKTRHLTFEYLVLKGCNHSSQHVNALSRLLNGLKCRINLIGFNAISDSPFRKVEKEEMELFSQKLKQKGFIVTIRQSKGEDISAACGLLATKNSKKK